MSAMSKGIQSLMNGKMMKDIGPGALIGMGVNAYFGVDTYNTAKSEGNGTFTSAAKAVGEMVMVDAIGFGAYIGIEAVTGLPKAAIGATNMINQQARSMTYASINRNTPFATANYMDTQQAYTMRQAGMTLAKASKYNLQQTMMGNEAQFMHL